MKKDKERRTGNGGEMECVGVWGRSKNNQNNTHALVILE